MVLAGISSLYTAALIAAWGIGILVLLRIPSHRTLHCSATHLVLRSCERAVVVPCEQGSAGRRQSRYSAMSTFFFRLGTWSPSR